MPSYTSVHNRQDYDQKNDILYIHFPTDRGNSYGEEVAPGIEEMHDIDTDEVTGLMIFYPERKYQERQQALDALGYDIDLLATTGDELLAQA